MPGIVVGIDGSEHSQHVLEWAMREAALKKAPLTVLTVHQVAGNQWNNNPMVLPGDLPLEEKARQAAEDLVSKAASEIGDPGPGSVTVRTVSGSPAKELIAASQGADMVVVGARGGGGFAGLLMGSVTAQVAHHALCPVVVVR